MWWRNGSWNPPGLQGKIFPGIIYTLGIIIRNSWGVLQRHGTGAATTPICHGLCSGHSNNHGQTTVVLLCWFLRCGDAIEDVDCRRSACRCLPIGPVGHSQSKAHFSPSGALPMGSGIGAITGLQEMLSHGRSTPSSYCSMGFSWFLFIVDVCSGQFFAGRKG